ncbi:MAG: hypothetical protein K2Y23_21585 [Cyanobacteria bacterium]|nr:hypothetical protein [Cyanobacteriota bacterium]
MRTGLMTSIASFGISIAAAAQQPLNVGTITVAAPVQISEIDTDRMKGQPARLAWSPDGSQFYLQMLDGNFGQGGGKLKHYVLAADTGRRQEVPAEPEWASAYWTSKSGQISPDGPPMKIDLKSESRTEKTVSAPMGGDLARGGVGVATGASAGDGVSAAYSRQTSLVHSMFLNGELVGEFVNSVIVPGLTFGWGPRGSRVLAFAAVKNGRIIVMDDQGIKKEVSTSGNGLLPAWSPDATRLAWVEREGRKKFTLQVARVSRP